jgi:hypothetical protein
VNSPLPWVFQLPKENNPGWSNCVFCGEAVGKAARSREHILPMWMLRATGDPNRRIRIEIDPVTGQDIVRPASTFHFPACGPCNESYGTKLEAQAKKAMEGLFAGKSLQVSQCYWLLDWLDKVRIGLWLAYNTIHKEFFQPKFRIDQRLGKKDRLAVISVDPDDQTKGFGFGGLDNNIFRTSQAGMYLRINNVRIISVSYENFISRFAGMPYAKEVFASTDDLNKHLADIVCDGHDLQQDWGEFALPDATVIAQSIFWPGGAIANDRWQMYLNAETVGRLRYKPRISRPEHLNRFFQTQLISNADGFFRYYDDPRKRLPFGKARNNDDANFVRILYAIYLKHILPLNPQRVIDGDGKRYGIIVLGMLWLENFVQVLFRMRDLGIEDRKLTDETIDELHRATRLWEESVANLQGTCVPEHSRLMS